MDSYLAKIKETQALLLNQTTLTFKRFLYPKINFESRLIGIIGPRGVGKTTLILQYLKERGEVHDDFLYFTADSVLLEKGSLVELAREAYLKNGIRLLCIDEIHRFPNWNQELKNIYDSFPKLKIIFSGSSSLNLIKGKYDLSRRAISYELPGLSFREFLIYEKGIEHKTISFKELITKHKEISKEIAKTEDVLLFFSNYLKHHYYPFYKEELELPLYYQQINAIIDKTIYEDIASCYKLKTENLLVFKQILAFLASIPPGEINTHKISKHLKKNHETITTFLNILHETKLIRFLGTEKIGHALLKHTKKVFVDNPNILHALCYSHGLEINHGYLRELFVLNQTQNAGLKPIYNEKADVEIAKTVFEIGGKQKKVRKSSNITVLSDDLLVSDGDKIPLYLFGFLY